MPAESWPALAGLAQAHGLGPMLAWRLRQAGYDALAGPDRSALIQSAHQAALHFMVLDRAQREITAALRQANIPALWLKGAALARTVYPEPALRPMADLDVLVPYEKRQAALEVVRGLGYDFYELGGLGPHSGDELALKLSPHHYHLRGGVANSVILELHFRLLGHDDLLPLEQLRWFWDHTQTLTLDDGTELGTLAPEAHLLYLCAHAMLQHGEAQLYLLRYFDLHQLITQSALDWDAVVDQAVALGWTFAVERALRRTGEFFATPVPAAVVEALVQRRPAYEDVSRVWRLQGRGERWEHLRRQLARLSTREKLKVMGETVFPPPAYMRQRYHVKPGWPAWPYYLYRWFDQGREVLWAVAKRLAGRGR